MNRIIAIILLSAFLIPGCITPPPPVYVPGPTDQTPVVTSAEVAALRPRALEVVRKAISGDDILMRLYAAEVIADTALLEFVPDLRALLEDAAVPARFAAAMAFGDMNYLPARAALERAASDPDHNVRIAAAYALCRLGYDSQHEKTIYQGLSDPDQTLRANSALVLGKLARRSSVDALYWMMRDRGSSEDARLQAAYSLAMIGDDAIYSTVWTMLISSYANYRILGIEAMAALNDGQAKQAILTMLDDDVLDVRLAAAEKLGKLGDRSGSSNVLDYLRRPATSSDRTEAERRAVRAANAIGAIATPDLTAFLPALLENNSPIVSLAAARAVLNLSK